MSSPDYLESDSRPVPETRPSSSTATSYQSEDSDTSANQVGVYDRPDRPAGVSPTMLGLIALAMIAILAIILVVWVL